ncbi:MAG TPA: YggS family pyridoxal phosphate-dependent enzyme [Flavobacteriales bacterium]
MSEIAENIQRILHNLQGKAKLVAVSKTKPIEAIQEAYDAGQRAFGENYVQELIDKQPQLPQDIEWHLIGHVQTNKVKYVAPFVSWIHAVDSEKLLTEINKQAAKHERVINCLLQVHIAQEESKYGIAVSDIKPFCESLQLEQYPYVNIRGLMGMASFCEDFKQITEEFRLLKSLFDDLKATRFQSKEDFDQISMGMSGDWPIAVEEGSTIVRIGSAIFGSR